MANTPLRGPIATLFLGVDGDGIDESDYRAVPATDVGNRAYTDRGMRGTYAPRSDDFPDPAGLKRFTGYGADEGDLRRGFVANPCREDPAYDGRNYRDRATEPKRADEQQGNTMSMPEDFAFRMRNRKARGFLTRPHIPTER